MDIGTRLDSWKRECLDLSRPRGPKREKSLLTGAPHEVLDAEGDCMGFAGLNRIGGVIELHTVVIDETLRGKGVSHTLIDAVVRRWRQDRILHGSSIQPPVDLAAAVRGEKPDEKPWRKPLICFTRHPSLAATLISKGFVHPAPTRRWWCLWLRRHPLGILSTRALLSIAFNRFIRGTGMLVLGEELPAGARRVGVVRQWFQRRRRLFHQLSFSSGYRLFLLDTDSMITSRRDSDESMADRLAAMGLDMTLHKRLEPIDSEEVEVWDEGTTDETPFVDLSSEE